MRFRAPFQSVAMSISLTLVCLFSPFQAASQIHDLCKAQPIKGTSVSGRANVIEFPNGRRITVVGHLHGHRQIYALGRLVNAQKLQTLSDHEFQDLFRRILKENRAEVDASVINSNRRQTLRVITELTGQESVSNYDPNAGFELENVSVLNHAQEDLQYIRESLRSQKIEFIGWEGSQERLNENLPAFFSVVEVLKKEFSLRRSRGGISLTPAEFNEALLTSMNANTFHYVVDPRNFSTAPLIGAEDETAGDLHESKKPHERIREAWTKLEKFEKSYLAKLSKEEVEVLKQDPVVKVQGSLLVTIFRDVEAMVIDSEEKLQSAKKSLNVEKMPWLREAVDELFDAFSLRIKANLLRDSATAVNLASRFQSGVHFIGLNHQRNLIRNLENICEVEQRRSANAEKGVTAR